MTKARIDANGWLYLDRGYGEKVIVCARAMGMCSDRDVHCNNSCAWWNEPEYNDSHKWWHERCNGMVELWDEVVYERKENKK